MNVTPLPPVRSLFRKEETFLVTTTVGSSAVAYSVDRYEHIAYPHMMQFVCVGQLNGRAISSMVMVIQKDSQTTKAMLLEACDTFDKILTKIMFS
jgi:hypothetical protein